jgi:hypothetical protein
LTFRHCPHAVHEAGGVGEVQRHIVDRVPFTLRLTGLVVKEHVWAVHLDNDAQRPLVACL